jgi:uncharacterized protein DUF6600
VKPSLSFKWLIPMLLLVAGSLAAAQEYPAVQDQDVDPPTRVARLQFIQGQVSLQPGGVEDWTFAGLNRPVTTADRLWVDRDSRAELTIGTAAIRVGDETSIAFTNLSDNVAQVELDQGTLSLFVRYLGRGELIEIDTPNIAFTADRPGEYRIDVNPDEGRTWVQVRRGSGTASGQNESALLERGQLYEFFNGDSGEYTAGAASPRDDFEAWCGQRERRQIESVSLQYVAPGTIGYEALDEAGDWQPEPTYGTVWFPRVSAGWAPYHEGHWIWVEPWGWTWVDDEPWGFAPFHYGRWAFIRSRWGWIPGPREVRPVYAPALVAWIGGSNFSISIGIGGGGGVGWVPLGWHDPYLPYYHVSRRYAEQVNITNSRVVNTTIINNYYSTTNVNVRNTTINNIRYENVRVQNAVTVIPHDALATGRPVQQTAVRVQPQMMTQAVARGGMFAPAPSVVPTKQAVLGPRPVTAAPARLVIPKQVVAKTPPPPPPVSFERQRPLLEKNQGRPLPPQERMALRTTSPAPPTRTQPPTVTVKPNTRPAPPVANKPATPPRMREAAPNATAGGGAAPTPGGTPTPSRGAPLGRPTVPGRPEGGEAGTPAARPTPPGRPVTPATPATPATPSAGPGARPATPATPATPASPAMGRENAPANRPAPMGRPTPPTAAERENAPANRPAPMGRPTPPTAAERENTPANRPAPMERPTPEGRETNRPGVASRPDISPEATPERPTRPAPQTMERPTPPSRPTPQERTMERPTPPTRPTPPAAAERPAPPSRPAPQERTMERPAPPTRPAPQERTMERPAPPTRPTPQERTMERPAPPSRPAPQERTMERPAPRPPEERQPPRGNQKDNKENKDNQERNNPPER